MSGLGASGFSSFEELKAVSQFTINYYYPGLTLEDNIVFQGSL